MNQPQLQTFTNLLALVPRIPIISGVGQIFAGQGLLESAMVTYWISQTRIPSTSEVVEAVKEIEDGINKRTARAELSTGEVLEQ
jgi:hypothetical protein